MFQMAPLNWMMLYTFFSMIFLMFNMKNYYIYNINFKNKCFKKNNYQINWKW
uniref:ATP synthase F0 subunit 8 n=1 Tax=Stenus clavicornis TaxID=1202167 RepID=A0A191ZS22_9COLE|nr:ATP synthase F0 subunit 8 [Stenus clavicornis]